MSEKYAFWVTLRPQSDRCHQGEAKVRILNFKTTWLEFQRASQTATKQGEAKLCIINFRTKWSECQKLKQTIATNSIPLPLFVVLELCIHSSALSSSVVV